MVWKNDVINRVNSDFVERNYLNTKTILFKTKCYKFLITCVLFVMGVFIGLIGYTFLVLLPFTIFHLIFMLLGYTYIGGMIYLFSKEYNILNKSIKFLEESCKDYKELFDEWKSKKVN